MMKSLKQVGMLAAIGMIASANFAHASKHVHFNADPADHSHCDFIPENDLEIPEAPAGYEGFAGGITEAEFNGVIDKVEKIYAPIIKSKGGTLDIKRLWKKSDSFKGQNGDTLNAFALREGKMWYVAMFGGLARHPVTSVDGFTLVLCHELGHHLAGYPKVPGNIFQPAWASNEGQSDYFATMKCARNVWAKEDNAKALASMSVPALVKEKCSVQHKSTLDIQLCERGAMGGMNLGTLLWNLSNGTKGTKNTELAALAGKSTPKFETPDTSQVSSINDKHPQAQCRLDTYFAGAVCGIAASEEFGQKDGATGACAEERGDSFGVRSRCWYKPKK